MISEAWLPQNSKYSWHIRTSHVWISDNKHTLYPTFLFRISAVLWRLPIQVPRQISGQLHQGALTFGEKEKAPPWLVLFQSKEVWVWAHGQAFFSIKPRADLIKFLGFCGKTLNSPVFWEYLGRIRGHWDNPRNPTPKLPMSSQVILLLLTKTKRRQLKYQFVLQIKCYLNAKFSSWDLSFSY